MPSFHPPIRPTPRQPGPQTPTEPLTWMQQIAQKDDLLLWITAALGVLMPGVIYLVYHKVHAAYMRYAKRKEAKRLADEKAREELAIFYTRGVPRMQEKDGQVEDVFVSVAEKRARQLEELMGEEKPKIVAIEELEKEYFRQFRGFAIFIVECNGTGHAQDSYEWFLDWLETAAADKKEKKRLQTAEMKYSILGMSEEANVAVNKAADTLSKRLRILGATSVVPDRNFDVECEGCDPDELFRVWAEDLFVNIDRYGLEEEEEFEDEVESGEEEEEEEGESEEEMNDPTAEGMRRRRV